MHACTWLQRLWIHACLGSTQVKVLYLHYKHMGTYESIWCSLMFLFSLSVFARRTFASSYLSFCTSSSVAIPSKWVCVLRPFEVQRCSEHERRQYPHASSSSSTPDSFPQIAPPSLPPWDVWALIDMFIYRALTCVMFPPWYGHMSTLCYYGGVCVCMISHCYEHNNTL